MAPEPKTRRGHGVVVKGFSASVFVDTDKQTLKCVFGLNPSLKMIKDTSRCSRGFYSWVTWNVQVGAGCVFCFSVIRVFASNPASTRRWDCHPPPARRVTWSHFRCNRFSHVCQQGFVCRCFGRSTFLLCDRIHIITPGFTGASWTLKWLWKRLKSPQIQRICTSLCGNCLLCINWSGCFRHAGTGEVEGAAVALGVQIL